MSGIKKAVIVLLCSIIAGVFIYYIKNSSTENIKQEPPESKILTTAPQPKPEQKPVPSPVKKEIPLKKTNLYGNIPNNMLPLSAVPVITDLSENIKKTIDELIENTQGLYWIERSGDKIFVIAEVSEDCPRHGIEFIEINVITGEIDKETPGVHNDEGESDEWQYDKDTQLPLKHIKYDSDKDVEYTETWNYSQETPVKYEMKNSEGKTISVKKENIDGEAGMRSEHIIYDDEGKIDLNISVSYDGADITRFTYYNSETPGDGVVVMSEYSDGLKSKETVYTSDYKLKNTYKAVYKDGERAEITVYDASEKEVEKLLSE